MTIALKSLRSALLCGALIGALFGTASTSALAQNAPRKGLELTGSVTAVDSTNSSVSVDGQRLTLTPQTYVSSADPTIDTNISLKWVGQPVEYEWSEYENKAILSDLHFPGAAR